MPKVVDSLVRREEVAQALFRVVAASGLESASLRTVAAEAGLAVGSVRHYFQDQSELMIFAFRTVSSRIRGRVEKRVMALEAAQDGDYAVGQDADGDDAVGQDAIRPVVSKRPAAAACVDVLMELLPVDQERRLESSVWLSFVTAARTDRVLGDEADGGYRGTAILVGRIIMVLLAAPETRMELDPVLEAERLLALIDGLCLHMLLQPGWSTEELSRTVVETHLASLKSC
ncbi:TetR family transcriptional regulator C-terminal domain-containing protein [Paeniglutamicibacter antarcticus]|uniref:TetR family transcriptional regulator C-terminal domain-containing protein n=1 Tax=Arthrobacter terrae TaxID=2935737 RepID=A0A931G8M3_9MICC|nr:TetR family transcriptional regulator C-terminal domain-containing protein [Arthrobacter terrae]MBG0740354.1 TetR family transcriptional regulator C-terminal domain-containing protein [Arthrobacter terrae]